MGGDKFFSSSRNLDASDSSTATCVLFTLMGATSNGMEAKRVSTTGPYHT